MKEKIYSAEHIKKHKVDAYAYLKGLEAAWYGLPNLSSYMNYLIPRIILTQPRKAERFETSYLKIYRKFL